MRLNSKTIAFYGVSVALLFVTLLVETFVFKLFMPITPAIISLPLAFSLSMFNGKKSAFFGGTALGVCSFVLSFIIGVPPFMNPLISVLPRVLCGAVSAGVYALTIKLCKNKKFSGHLAASLGGAAGVLLNTLTVVFMLFVFEYGTISAVLTTVLSINFLFEFLGGIILCPIVVTLLLRFVKKGTEENPQPENISEEEGEKTDETFMYKSPDEKGFENEKDESKYVKNK